MRWYCHNTMSQAVSQAESNAETWCLQVPASEARRGEAKSWYSRAGLVIGSPIEQSNQFEFLRAGCIKGPRFPLLNHCVLLLLLLDIHTTAGSPHAALDLSFSAAFNYLLRLLCHVSISSTLWKSSRSRALSARGYVRKGSLTCLTTAT